ncbi:MAG: hypothetical protein ACTSQY_03430 [Candidatus Odinarchaeia archaeon]
MSDADLEEKIKGMKKTEVKVPLIQNNKELTFNLAYFAFNSIKIKRAKFLENKIPFSASAVFIDPSENMILQIKVPNKEDKCEITCWGNEEQKCEEKITKGKEKITSITKKINEENKEKIKKYIEVLKLLDTTLVEVLNKSKIRGIYFPLANSREILYKIYETEKFEPLLLSMGNALEKLKKFNEEEVLNQEEQSKLSVSILKWKKTVINKINVLVG